MPEKPRALGAGLVALDVIIPDAHKPDRWLLHAGGSCGNVTTILSYMGWDAAPIARLDSSAETRTLKGDLETWQVDMKWVEEDPTGSTPIILQVDHNPGTAAARHKFHWRCLDCSGWYPRFKPFKKTVVPRVEAEETNPAVYYFDRAFPASIALAKSMRDRGAVIVFEPNGVRDEAQFHAALEVADVVKYSHERMAPQSDLLTELGAWLQVETMGRDGLRFLHNENGWEKLEALSAPYVVDTAGAGDWCTAVLVDRCFRRGRKALPSLSSSKIRTALREGQAYAALNCAYAGARGMMYGLTKEQLSQYTKALLEGKAEPDQFQVKSLETVSAAYCGSCRAQPPTSVPATSTSPREVKRPAHSAPRSRTW